MDENAPPKQVNVIVRRKKNLRENWGWEGRERNYDQRGIYE